MVRLGGFVLDGTNPIVDSYITQGIRISAMIPPVTDRRSGAVFSIRRQRMAKVTKKQLVEWQTATPEMLDFLSLCVNHGISVGLAGKTGSGKTTDISYLLGDADKSRRIYTIEETRELDLFDVDKEGRAQNRVIHTCIRPSDMENADVDMNDLLRKAMRFSPDIIVVAEMRGAEAMTAQEAARTGHVVVTSLHANSARKAYGRILSMCQMSGTNISTNILMGFVAEAFPVMVFKKQMPDGTRRIMEIVEALKERNIFSLYHYSTGEEMGSEKSGTHAFRYNKNSLYHLDYCFASDFFLKTASITIPNTEEWLAYSDHAPLIVDIV